MSIVPNQDPQVHHQMRGGERTNTPNTDPTLPKRSLRRAEAVVKRLEKGDLQYPDRKQRRAIAALSLWQRQLLGRVLA